MALLVAGLVLFLGVHLVPAFPSGREGLLARWGDRRYKAVFTAVAGAGLVLIVLGYARAPQVRLFAPSPAAIAAAPAAMALSMILFAAANLKGHLRRTIGHPMLLGTILWSAVHLFANGDLAGTLLFGGFLAWALVDLASAIARRAVKSFEPRIAHDAIAVAGGLVVFAVVAALHRPLFGPRVVSFGF